MTNKRQRGSCSRTGLDMETTKPAPATGRSNLTRTLTRILRFRRAATVSGGTNGNDSNLKLKRNLSEYPSGAPDSHIPSVGKATDKPQLEEHGSSCSSRIEPNVESLLANIFAGVSAIKAAYAQLQVAESPYDPDTIQASDEAVVSELKHLSRLKQSYLKKQQLQVRSPAADSQELPPPQLQEQRSLLKTYQITTSKLESGLRHVDAEFQSLQAQLDESERHNRSLESWLRCDPTLLSGNLYLSSLPTLLSGNLYLSSLDPKHFLSVLRLALKSVKSFVKQMAHEMESAGWDLGEAAGVIQPDVRGRPEHWIHAFESFVCQSMFARFQLRDFGISSLEQRSSLDRRRFFQDFVDLNSAKPPQAGISELGKFAQSKYLSLVHPKMEASFFGNLDRRTSICSGQWFLDSQFLALFAEMAKRVWLLHCLYFSYGPEAEAAIFQVKRGSRYSEVYMDNVAASPVHAVASLPENLTVKFMVAPGFRVGKTLTRCKVYVSKKG